MKRKLRNLRNDINTKRKENQNDPVSAFNRFVFCMKRFQDDDLFGHIPNEFVYDSSCEISIRIQHLINFYTLNKTFVWAGKADFERKELLVNDDTLTIFIPRNKVPFDTWRRSILFITYDRYTKVWRSKNSILRTRIYGARIYHNEKKNLYVEWRRFWELWGIDKNTFLGFKHTQKLVNKVKRSNDPKDCVDFFKLARDKYDRIQDIMAALVGEKDANVI